MKSVFAGRLGRRAVLSDVARRAAATPDSMRRNCEGVDIARELRGAEVGAAFRTNGQVGGPG